MKKHNVLYDKKGYTVTAPTKDDVETATKLFIEMLSEKVPDWETHDHTQAYIQTRRDIKTEIQTIYDADELYFIWKGDDILGYTSIDIPKGNFDMPVAEEFFMLKRFRKSKGFAHLVNFLLNYRFKDQTLMVRGGEGFGKLVTNDIFDIGLVITLPEVPKRIKKICEG